MRTSIILFTLTKRNYWSDMNDCKNLQNTVKAMPWAFFVP